MHHSWLRARAGKLGPGRVPTRRGARCACALAVAGQAARVLAAVGIRCPARANRCGSPAARSPEPGRSLVGHGQPLSLPPARARRQRRALPPRTSSSSRVQHRLSLTSPSPRAAARSTVTLAHRLAPERRGGLRADWLGVRAGRCELVPSRRPVPSLTS
jgi:hypothetical protein